MKRILLTVFAIGIASTVVFSAVTFDENTIFGVGTTSGGMEVDNSGNARLTGTLTVDGATILTGDTTLTLANGSDLTITATPESGPFISASSDDTTSGHLTMSSATITNALTMTGTLTHGTNKFAVTANGQTVYTVIIATALADTNEYEVTEMDGKAGWFEIYMGTHNVSGVFTTAASVTLSASSTASSSTSDNNAGTLNVFDAGTTIKIENQTATEQSISGFVSYRN